MKKKNIKNIFLISLISIFLLIFNIIIKKHLFIYAESIMAAFMIVVIVLSIQMFGFPKDINNRLKKILFFRTGQLIATYFIVIYALGLFFGFSKIVFSVKPLNIINNTLALIIIFVALEVFRFILINNNRDNKKNIILYNIIIGLLELSISTKYLSFNTIDLAYKSFADFLIPITVKQLALGTLCYHAGLKPTILYRVTIILYTYAIPIHPNFSETIVCMCNILLPVLILNKTNMVLDEERKSNEQPVPQSGAGEYIIGGALMGAMLLLVLGITPVGITAIASDSMHPTFGKGSGVITLKVKEDKLKEGDIISFTKDNKTVIHRINKVEKEDKEIRYYTKGDANNTVDDGYITYEDINNKVLFSIPLIGYPAIIISDIFSK